MTRTRLAQLVASLAIGLGLLVATGSAQFRGRDISVDRRGIPDWKNPEGFKDDVFTFARVRYTSWGRDRWATDYPDSDLNFSYRLQELTSIKVNPNPVIVDLTDEKLLDYPFLYIIEPGQMNLTEAEIDGLKRYLDNGGFVMIDDFWGDAELENLVWELKRVFPDKELSELPMEHPIFHIVYDLKEKPQVPSINAAHQGRPFGVTWERGEEGRQVHYKGLFDDKGRLMVIVCHNTDLGDGWEREGEDAWYFKEFAEKKAYPMGINIIFYAMTH